MSLRSVIPVLLAAAAVAWCAIALDAPAVAAVAVGAAAALIGLLPLRRAEPRTASGMLAHRLGYLWRRRTHRAQEFPQAFDVPLPDGGSYGLRWDGDRLLTMLRINPPPDALTLLRPGSLSTDQVLPLTDIARCLVQFDIALASIDVISIGARTAQTGFVAQLYDRIIGPLPAIAHRTVWLVLRLDPLANAAAVDRRGGGGTGVTRSAIIATRRVANRLAARDIAVSVLTATEMNNAVRELTRGITLAELTETPTTLRHNDLHLTSYEIGAGLISSRGFADIWATQSRSTTVTLRLRTAADNPAQRDREPMIALDAVVRFDTTHEFAEPPVPGLRALPGRQLPTLLACLPTGSHAHRSARTSHRGPLPALTGLVVPTGGCGQLIGADELGQGIAVPLAGDGTRHLDVIGTLALAQQVILRAIALGARVVVHSDRPEAWHSMVTNVGSPYWLSMAPRSAAASHPPAAPQPGAPAPTASMLVFDGIAPAASPGGATIVHVRPSRDPGGSFDADVTLVQDDRTPNQITVRTAGASTTVHMVTTPDEMRYIGESLIAVR
ncbi:type VII secretion protein EccE [Nocardia sp. NPDC051787]|uniref:type VII secretion protein EccE n=1 Tax=Nocardia sp. NPDC051787 TaxID=3155415 RepID=UPI003413D760